MPRLSITTWDVVEHLKTAVGDSDLAVVLRVIKALGLRLRVSAGH